MYIGTIGLFVFLLLLFLRFLPMISIFEMRTLVPAGPEATGDVARAQLPHAGGPRSAENPERR
jgi:hypothetical protein